MVGDPGIEPGMSRLGGVTVPCRTLQRVAQTEDVDNGSFSSRQHLNANNLISISHHVDRVPLGLQVLLRAEKRELVLKLIEYKEPLKIIGREHLPPHVANVIDRHQKMKKVLHQKALFLVAKRQRLLKLYKSSPALEPFLEKSY